jgi:hypothetical protein
LEHSPSVRPLQSSVIGRIVTSRPFELLAVNQLLLEIFAPDHNTISGDSAAEEIATTAHKLKPPPRRRRHTDVDMTTVRGSEPIRQLTSAPLAH